MNNALYQRGAHDNLIYVITAIDNRIDELKAIDTFEALDRADALLELRADLVELHSPIVAPETNSSTTREMNQND